MADLDTKGLESMKFYSHIMFLLRRILMCAGW